VKHVAVGAASKSGRTNLNRVLSLVLWRARRRLQKVLMEGKPPAPREAEAAFRSVE